MVLLYITTEVAKTVVILLRGFTTLPPRTHLTLEAQSYRGRMRGEYSP